MITLRRGDQLPTVTVLQSYLNQQPSTGEYLAVDGIFGPRTEAAVRRFCTSSGIGRRDFVDYEVWRGVVGAEWQIIDSVEANKGVGNYLWVSTLTPSPSIGERPVLCLGAIVRDGQKGVGS